LQKLTRDHPTEGFWKYNYRLRNAGETINHKRLHRVYKQLNLPLRRKCKKRVPSRVKEPLVIPESFTHTWSIDFMRDAIIGSRKFRTFNVIDAAWHLKNPNNQVYIWTLDISIKAREPDRESNPFTG